MTEQPSDSYGSWSLAIRAWREQRVRTGEYEPKTDEERRWALAGPVPVSSLESLNKEPA